MAVLQIVLSPITDLPTKSLKHFHTLGFKNTEVWDLAVQLPTVILYYYRLTATLGTTCRGFSDVLKSMLYMIGNCVHRRKIQSYFWFPKIFFWQEMDSGFMNILCTLEKPLLQVLPIIQVLSLLKELSVLSLIVLVRAFSEKVCPGLMTSSTTLCVLYWWPSSTNATSGKSCRH